MTIKPIVAPSQKRSGAGGVSSEGDKKDTHSGSNVNDAASNSHQTVNRASNVHAHRNVVIDGHGQSPQRRVDVYDDLNRHRRSPHKNTRSKRRDHHTEHHHNKRDKHADKHVASVGNVNNKCNSPHAGTSSSSGPGSSSANNNAAPHVTAAGSKSPEHLLLGSQSPKTQPSSVAQAASGLLKAIEDTFSGYNSGDEHLQPKEGLTTADEWQRKDEQFAKCMADQGYVLKPVEEDGACLFRSISLQIYGDEEMHDVIRQHTMDYINKNREYFSHFVTEDINSYIKRKRRKDSHGNHIEIQAMSEIYSRPVEVYCYKPKPINIFNSEQSDNGYAPLRLSYQRGSHYNAIIDPYNATVGVGLGLAGYKPDLQTKEAARLSEQLEIEQTMFEDKLKNSDWEATNEAIEEQIARESYLQWCRDNLQKTRNATASTASTSATVTSGQAASDSEASPSKYAAQRLIVSSGANSSNLSTVTSLAVNSASSSSLGTSNTSTNLEHNFANLSPKHLATLGHMKKSDEGGFESDDTDISSTSSAGNASPSVASRSKKSKTRTLSSSAGPNLRLGKKRRRDLQNNMKNDEEVLPAHKSPKCDNALSSPGDLCKRSVTPDLEHQKPCTSKQSNSPDKHSTDVTPALPSSSNTTAATVTTPSNTSSVVNKQKPNASFYQELLEASYANDGFGQLSESEMLQRAIQMSTNDYIEDQKRKYLYGP